MKNKMTLGRAIATVKSINSPCPTADVQEKLEAIKAITEAATLNSVTKQDLLRIIRWMWAMDTGKLLCENLKPTCNYVATGGPLTLEQLREMDGQPVWIVESPNWGHWELSDDAEDYLCDRDTDLYGLSYPDPDGKEGLHKLGWLAYAYPPAHIDLLARAEAAEEENRKLRGIMVQLRKAEHQEKCSVVYEMTYSESLSAEQLETVAAYVFRGLMKKDLERRNSHGTIK